MKTWRCLGPRRLLAALAAVVCAVPAQAVPRRLILLRHGEKANDYALCSLGQERSIAVRDTYLGRGARAANSLRGPRHLHVFIGEQQCYLVLSHGACEASKYC